MERTLETSPIGAQTSYEPGADLLICASDLPTAKRVELGIAVRIRKI